MIKPLLADWVFEDWSQIIGSQLLMPKDLRQHPCQLCIQSLNPFKNITATEAPRKYLMSWWWRDLFLPKIAFPLLDGFASSKKSFLVLSGNLLPKFPCIELHSPIWIPFCDKTNFFQSLSALTSWEVVQTCIIWASKKQAQPMKWQIVQQSGLTHTLGPVCLSLNPSPTVRR